MMNEDISLDLWLHQQKLHRSHLSFLKYFVEDTQHFLPVKHKWLTDLNNLGLIWDGEITEKGKELWQQVVSWDGVYDRKEQVKKKKPVYSEEFLEWLSYFPKTDEFDGFMGTRQFHKKLPEASTKYDQLIRKVDHMDMIESLRYEVDYRKELSRQKGTNELSFLSNTFYYLKQNKFESFLGRGLFKSKLTDNRQTII